MGLFSRKPKTVACFFCAEQVEEADLLDHYHEHLIAVRDNNGHQAYTFECPRCGLMDLSWGGGRPNPKVNAAAALALHLNDRHNIPF